MNRDSQNDAEERQAPKFYVGLDLVIRNPQYKQESAFVSS